MLVDKDLNKSGWGLPCSVIFVSVDSEGRQNAMTACAMFTTFMDMYTLLKDPPLIAISMAKHILTHELIKKAGEFAINVASINQVGLAKKLGRAHGEEMDKLKEFQISTEPASRIKSPLISDCFAYFECKVRDSFVEGNYIIFIGEVIAYRIRKDLSPLLWFEDKYFELGREIL